MSDRPEPEFIGVQESFDKPETAMFAKKEDVVPPGAASMKNEWSVGALKPTKIDDKPAAYLTQLAKDIVGNLVFTDRHIREFDFPTVFGMVFMPVMLGAFADTTEEYRNDIGMIYEYIDKAGPRSINGYPIFFSMCYINKHDAQIVWEKVAKIEEALKAIE